VQSVFLVVQYMKNETTGLNKNFEYINYHSHEDRERLQEISSFKPNNKELDTDFNMAFGFIGKHMPSDIGQWRVKYLRKSWDSQKFQSVGKNAIEHKVRNCGEKEFKKKFVNPILVQLMCSDVFENELYGDYFSDNFTYVQIDLIPCLNKKNCQSRHKVKQFFKE
jgi:hypothetical protein